MIRAGSLARRNFAANDIRTVCILANSRQADLIGSKIIRSIQDNNKNTDFHFIGYGGPWMKQEGFDPTIEVDIDQFADKTFTTYRKTKTQEQLYFKWNPWNLINKHYTRLTDDVHDSVSLSSLQYLTNPCCVIVSAIRFAKEDLSVAT